MKTFGRSHMSSFNFSKMLILSALYLNLINVALSQLATSANEDTTTEIPFVEQFNKNPDETYLKIKTRYEEARLRGEVDFDFMEMRPTLEAVKRDLETLYVEIDLEQTPLTARNIRTVEELNNLQNEVNRRNELKREVYQLRDDFNAKEFKDILPYRSFLRLVFRYIGLRDVFVRIKNPMLKPIYFKNQISSMLLEKLLEKAPRMFLFPAFESIDMEFFINTRLAPMFPIGLVKDLIYADRFSLSPSEFAHHDLEHAYYLNLQNEISFEDAIKEGKDIEDVIYIWKDTLKYFTQEFSKIEDADLKKSITLMLFELLHEIAYNLSLDVLWKQIGSNEHLEKVVKKLDCNFITNKNNFLTPHQKSLLPTAYRWIRTVINDKIAINAKHDMQDKVGQTIPMTILRKPFAAEGKVQAIELTETGRIRISFAEEDVFDKNTVNIRTLNLYELPMMKSNEKNTFDKKEVIVAFENLMLMRHNKMTGLLLQQYIPEADFGYRIDRLFLEKDHHVRVILKSMNEKTKQIELGEKDFQVIGKELISHERHQLSQFDQEKLEVLLDSWQRDIKVQYRVLSTFQKTVAKIIFLNIENNSVTIEEKTVDNQKIIRVVSLEHCIVSSSRGKDLM